MDSVKGPAKATLKNARQTLGLGNGRSRPLGEARPVPHKAGTIVLVTGQDARFNDLVVAAAKRRFPVDSGLVFPLKVATRLWQPEADVLAVSRQAFADMALDGCFLAVWSGEGRHYGLPAACRDALETGRTIVVAAPQDAVGAFAAEGFSVAVIEVAGVTGGRLTRAPSARPGDGGGSAALLARIVHGGKGAEAVKAVLEVLARLTSSRRSPVVETAAVAALPERPADPAPPLSVRPGRGTRRRASPARVAAIPVS